MKTEKNIIYKTIGDLKLFLDITWHPGSPKPTPLVIWIHGGAWLTGDRTWIPPKQPLPQKGFAFASIEYRLSPRAIFPAQIEDCKTAVRWLRGNASKYNIDPARIGVWGESAGGHLAALLGTSAEKKEWDLNEPYPEMSSEVQAVCDWFGPTDFIKMAELYPDHGSPESPESRLIGRPVLKNPKKVNIANPITYISEKTAPFLIIHGKKDEIVPANQSELLHQALISAGISSQLEIIPDMGHGVLSFDTELFKKLYEMVLNFFKAKL